MNAARERAAEFWDHHVARWLAGEDPLDDRLSDWLASYDGRGEGAVERGGMVEPYTGDLRGVVKTPRVVVLGLNPGRYYPQFQSRPGMFARRDPRTWVLQQVDDNRSVPAHTVDH
jgi:hypothetical protein